MFEIWEEAPVFVAVAKHLSFSRAAKELYYSQPYVSKQIRSLETKLGVKLIERTTTTVTLTPAGEVFYDHCLAAEEEMQIASRDARSIERNSCQMRPLRVLVRPFCESLAAMVLERFIESYPSQSIEVVNESWEGIPEGFTHDIEIDYVTESEEIIEGTILYRDVECVHLSNEAAKKAPYPISVHDFGSYTFVTLDKIGRHGKWKDAISTYMPGMHVVTTNFMYGFLDTLERSSKNVTIWPSYIKPTTLPDRTIIPIKEARLGMIVLRVGEQASTDFLRKAEDRYQTIAIELGGRVQEVVISLLSP